MPRLMTLVTAGDGPRLELLARVRRQIRAMRETLFQINSISPETGLGMAAHAASESLGEVLAAGSPRPQRRTSCARPDRKTNALPRGDR